MTIQLSHEYRDDMIATNDEFQWKNIYVKAFLKISELKMSTLQKERFKFLLGQRYRGKDKIKIVSK